MRLDELEWMRWPNGNSKRELAPLPSGHTIYRNRDGSGFYAVYTEYGVAVYFGLDAIEAQCILYELLKE